MDEKVVRPTKSAFDTVKGKLTQIEDVGKAFANLFGRRR